MEKFGNAVISFLGNIALHKFHGLVTRNNTQP